MISSSIPTVRVWYAFQHRNSHILHALHDAGLLSIEEKLRYERYCFQEDKALFLLSHALLRLTLSMGTSVAPRDWRFERSAHGKPAIVQPAEYQQLRFNLSHTRGLAACAISDRFNVGVDVEYSRRPLSSLPIAERFFAPEEIAYLEARPPEELCDAFFDIWTLKEAYIKACGSGLFAEPLQDFSMEIAETGDIHIRIKKALSDPAGDWQFCRFRPAPDYRMALAIHRPGNADVLPEISEADLRLALS
jgi:4'-phosphopantetheinyl transferase